MKNKQKLMDKIIELSNKIYEKTKHEKYYILTKEIKMKKKEALEVLRVIDQEGFDYSFTCYSNFEEIEDEEFHELREAYLKAQEKLERHLFQCARIETWEDLLDEK
jgi:uncharacterized protein YnzC (UPF0291/DUF896 family)